MNKPHDTIGLADYDLGTLPTDVKDHIRSYGRAIADQQTTHLTAEVDRLKKALEEIKRDIYENDVETVVRIIDNALNQ